MKASRADRMLARCVEVDGCWEFRGARTAGYARVKVGGVLMLGHRLAYETFIAPIPDGLHLDHLCRNPACVNPWHVEPVPQRVNTLRGVGPAAENARKQTCPQGHPYDIVEPRGSRICHRCRLAWRRQRRAAGLAA